MGEETWTIPGRFTPAQDGIINGTAVSLVIPARLSFLTVISEMVREYCAALPAIFAHQTVEKPHHEVRARRFGTGRLTLPGEEGKTIELPYSHFVYSVQLILQEVCTNILRHGYDGSEGFVINVNLCAALVVDNQGQTRQALIMELIDTALPFDPTKVVVRQPDPLELQEGGYGMFLIHKLTDKLDYARKEGRNHLKMIKYIGE
jgi:anti-sigma regulatory factor (Ser/Thr protein kinase)